MFRNLEAEQARKGKNNSDMADVLGISRRTYEIKKTTGKFYFLEMKKLSVFFGVTFDYLFSVDDEHRDKAS